MIEQIQYRRGYKYSLWKTYRVLTRIRGYAVKHRLFELEPDGWLTIFEDYPWDGASGLTVDTKDTFRNSLVHDAFFEMMRLGLLPHSCFIPANEELRAIGIEDGMWRLRADIWYKMVCRFGNAHAALAPVNVLIAP